MDLPPPQGSFGRSIPFLPISNRPLDVVKGGFRNTFIVFWLEVIYLTAVYI
jgi:hypothetical protein